MSNNNFAETLASVASEFGVEDTEKHGRGIKPSKRPYFRWTDEQLEQLATLRDEGKSANEIAEALGVSRDKVITKLAAMAARQRTRQQGARGRSKNRQRLNRRTMRTYLLPLRCPKLYVSDEAFDRMIFTAFDAVVGRVDDFNKMAPAGARLCRSSSRKSASCRTLLSSTRTQRNRSARSRLSSSTTKSAHEKRRCQDGNPDQRQRNVFNHIIA